MFTSFCRLISGVISQITGEVAPTTGCPRALFAAAIAIGAGSRSPSSKVPTHAAFVSATGCGFGRCAAVGTARRGKVPRCLTLGRIRRPKMPARLWCRPAYGTAAGGAALALPLGRTERFMASCCPDSSAAITTFISFISLAVVR